MKKLFIISLFAILLAGCNAIYKYIFLPPERLEYNLLPDPDMTLSSGEEGYFISKDGKMVGFDAKNWKIEIRYMPDYQLNTFEFPEESKNGEFSGNPFTFANWIDPQLGYTPRRFTVFKVTIYNYTSSKINFDPEISVLQTDRGDYFNAYGREKKNAKYQSLEEYYQRRKGTAGVDEEIFETRMGIARRTMLTYGRPIYKGDTRDGLIIFDPISIDVNKLKITIDRFIVGYDENNDPSDFQSLEFFFKQLPLEKEALDEEQIQSTAIRDSGLVSFSVAQIRYNIRPGTENFEFPWNPLPRSVSNVITSAERTFASRIKYVQGNFEEEAVRNSKMAFMFISGSTPEYSSGFISGCAEYLSAGGFLYIDNTFFRHEYPYNQLMESFISDVQKKITSKTEVKRVNFDHQVFKGIKEISVLPPGVDDLTPNYPRSDELKGLFIEGRLAILLSGKGYPLFWAGEGVTDDTQFQLDFGVNLLYYSIKK